MTPPEPHTPPAATEAPEAPEVPDAPAADWPRVPYLDDDDLVVAAEAAMALNRPLLLTGEPGTGKTSFAKHLADTLAPRRFGLQRPLRLHTFITKSTSMATDLFYRFDSLRRFHASHDPKMSQDNLAYLSFDALGLAILESHDWAEVSDLVPDAKDHPGKGVRSVVLIDEIDKAPRDFPNDILAEIDEGGFRIPELLDADGHVRQVQAAAGMRPLIVLTSNSEKNLPQAFLRRCVFHHISFPTDKAVLKKRLADIVSMHLTQAQGKLVDGAIDVFYNLRAERDIDKPPATAELRDWVQVLFDLARRSHRVPAETPLRALELDHVRGTLGVLAKGKRDVEAARRVLGDYYAKTA